MNLTISLLSLSSLSRQPFVSLSSSSQRGVVSFKKIQFFKSFSSFLYQSSISSLHISESNFLSVLDTPIIVRQVKFNQTVFQNPISYGCSEEIDIRNSLFKNCTSRNRYGGAISLGTPQCNLWQTIILHKNSFVYCSSISGGAIYAFVSGAYCVSCCFINCHSEINNHAFFIHGTKEQNVIFKEALLYKCNSLSQNSENTFHISHGKSLLSYINSTSNTCKSGSFCKLSYTSKHDIRFVHVSELASNDAIVFRETFDTISIDSAQFLNNGFRQHPFIFQYLLVDVPHFAIKNTCFISNKVDGITLKEEYPFTVEIDFTVKCDDNSEDWFTNLFGSKASANRLRAVLNELPFNTFTFSIMESDPNCKPQMYSETPKAAKGNSKTKKAAIIGMVSFGFVVFVVELIFLCVSYFGKRKLIRDWIGETDPSYVYM
ncbi:hypothetical protein GPJ56_001981 [Histomonas meleagridis]|uniref:uncharacterized protein n=1 Tax=Histomonas meleagridis TaxID=135588 RepID=UPI003559E8B2|nr:hypothetical protein GPJ56_001981 [Histomonas meleagridis]KAH0800943.1 hypothetical protein GO595_006259 [Histomonas meleagridis]